MSTFLSAFIFSLSETLTCIWITGWTMLLSCRRLTRGSPPLGTPWVCPAERQRAVVQHQPAQDGGCLHDHTLPVNIDVISLPPSSDVSSPVTSGTNPGSAVSPAQCTAHAQLLLEKWGEGRHHQPQVVLCSLVL